MAKGFSFSIGGKVHKGRIDVDRKALDAALATWPTCEATLTIETEEAKRSSAANRYLWGPVYDEIFDYTGQPKQDIHDEMCARFTTETITRMEPSTGEMIEFEVVRGTSGMKVGRFCKFVRTSRRNASAPPRERRREPPYEPPSLSADGERPRRLEQPDARSNV